MVLGNIPGTQTYHNLNRYREALRIPSFLILAVEAPIYFANSTYLQERLVHMFSILGISTYMNIFLLGLSYLRISATYRMLRWVREEEERVKAGNESTLKCIILDMTGMLFFKPLA